MRIYVPLSLVSGLQAVLFGDRDSAHDFRCMDEAHSDRVPKMIFMLGGKNYDNRTP